jgi:iron complex outermembrane receptor protein
MFSNVSKVETKGGQIIGEGQWDNGIKARASYSYQRAKDVDTGTTLTNSPRHLAKLNVSTPLFGGVRAGWETLYTSSRKTTLAGVGGYSLTNLTLLAQEWAKGLDVSLSVYNLFDKKYADPTTPDLSAGGLDALQQDERTFRFKLTYRF